MYTLQMLMSVQLVTINVSHQMSVNAPIPQATMTVSAIWVINWILMEELVLVSVHK